MLTCRHCGTALHRVFVDLGHQPPSNAYLPEDRLGAPEVTYPLKAYVCEECWLVQLPAHAAADALFTADYAYFSSVSKSWVAHAERYVAAMAERFGLTPKSFVIEVASNDGYLLQFVAGRGIPCLGLEPTASTAAAARKKGIETEEVFLGEATGQAIAAARGKAALVTANNVLAHVPDINDFVRGIAALLAPEGVATFEFPHLLRLVEGLQFDTIYHEHYSYLSLHTVRRVLDTAGLRAFDAEELPTHGGSLRLFACHEGARHETAPGLMDLAAAEAAAGITQAPFYSGLQAEAERIKDELLLFLINEKRAGRTVAGYGAAAKGNTLLNFAGVRADLLPFVCDAAPSKQGQYLPGSHIPIRAPGALAEARPGTVLILPWNIASEIVETMRHVRGWGGRFAVAVPRLAML
ncbi:MAG: methyltransferase domain-containing protein [Rhodomicrobium sp.]